MAATTSHRRNKDNSHSAAEKPMDSPKELTQNFVDYLTDYAEKNPGYTALWCLGIGFVLGWKLKPW